jgi:hypothetical protein
MSYNGWKNYETWNVALWLGNEEPLYREMRARAADKKFSGVSIRAFVEECMPNGTPDFRGRGGARAYAKVHSPSIADMANEA